MKILHYILLVPVLAGCVVFPVTRTYFEPNSEDGKPERSTSCGYNRAAYDSLVRDIGDLHVQVSPSYQDGQPISVTILFRFQSGNASVLPEQFQLQSLSDGQEYKPIEVRRKVYGPDNSHPYNSIWVDLKYPVMSEQLETIRIVIPMGAVTRSGLPIDVRPFRFKKVKKSDIYYGSINC